MKLVHNIKTPLTTTISDYDV